jgi:hypothetical protein
MDTTDFMALLKAIEGLRPHTLTAKMRAIYPAIEAKRAEGIQHAAILEALNEAGWNITPATYKGVLARIRRSAGGICKTPASAVLSPSPASTPEPLAQIPSGQYLTREERERRADQLMKRVESMPQPSILDRAKR